MNRVKGLLLSLAIICTLIIPISVNADNTFQPDANKYYAIIDENGKAVQNRVTGFVGPNNNDVAHTDGEVVNNKVLEMAAFRIVQVDGYYAFYCEAAKNNYLEFEDANGTVFSWSQWNSSETPRHHAQFALEKSGNGYKMISRQVAGCYLKVEYSTGFMKGTMDANEATVFEIREVSLLEETVKIESVSQPGQYLSYQDQSAGGQIHLSSQITSTEKFYPIFKECPETDSYTGKKLTTIAFKAKDKELYIGGNRWINEAAIDISFYDKAGGWESLVVEGNSDGTFSFRDPKFGRYVAINSNGVLEGNHEEKEKARFQIHTDTLPVVPTDFKVTNVENNQVSLSWKMAKDCLYSGLELIRATDAGFVHNVQRISVNGQSYTDETVSSGQVYYYKLSAYLGTMENPSLRSDDTDTLTVTTLSGVKPAVPTDFKIDLATQENTVKLTWNYVGNAESYKIYRSDSAYGEYKELASVTDNSYEHTFTTNHKYNNYYKVVAVNSYAQSAFSDSVSLEKNIFGEGTIIFAPTDDTNTINKIIEDLFKEQNDATQDAQFKGKHTQIYFKKGDYKATQCMNIGFYTAFNGLGKTPYDVELNNIAIPTYLEGDNATCNFWRSAENLSIIDTHTAAGYARNGADKQGRQEFMNWAVAQAAPLRRVYSDRKVSYDWNYGWASGGYVADCYFENEAGTHSGQQFYTRNSVINGNPFGTTLNNFYQGVESSTLNQMKNQALLNGNGTSNWAIPGENIENSQLASQQCFTNVATTPEVAEKPFLYIDDQGEYQVFVPAVRKNTKGVSWSRDQMGEGKSIPLSQFYIAKPADSAATINAEVAKGKHIYFTPGIYHAEVPIQVQKENTILLGTGMATIIPDNQEAAMKIGDVGGVRVVGLIFDAGAQSQYLLQVGNNGKHTDHAQNPMILQDLFFRIGGTTNTLTKAEDALEINNDNVICDHFWIWRADHGTGVTWEGNKSKHGLIVNGNDVTCYALFNEHFQEYDTLWNGENGATYFYQNEKCYDPISQAGWMSHNGTVNGYAAYKVANQVKKHYAVGLGIYNVFIYTGGTADALGDASKVSIQMDNAIEVPNSQDVIIENACTQTFANTDGALQKFNHIINGVGQPVTSGIDQENALFGEGWSRKYMISYRNGTAVVGNSPIGAHDQNGKIITGAFGELKTIQNVEQPNDLVSIANKNLLSDLYNANIYRVQNQYTPATWKIFESAMFNAKSTINNTNATQLVINNTYAQLTQAIAQLKLLDSSNGSQKQLTNSQVTRSYQTLITNQTTNNNPMNSKQKQENQEFEIMDEYQTPASSQTLIPHQGNDLPMIFISIVGGLTVGAAGMLIYVKHKKKLEN